MKTEIKSVTITPQYAEELLKMNINNRNVRQHKVDALAKAMTQGEWELSNDAITISEGNILLNGQHRLMAVVQSGVACPFILFTGAADKSFDVMDTPALRRVSDVIQRKGGTNVVRSEAAVRRYLNLLIDLQNEWETAFRFNNRSDATRRSMIDCYDNHKEDLYKWMSICSRLLEGNIAVVSPTLLCAFSMFLEKNLHHPEDKIKTFLRELLVDGATKHATILHVRKKLLRNKMKTEILARHDDFRFIIRAWNDYLLGKEVTIVKTNEDAFRFVRPY